MFLYISLSIYRMIKHTHTLSLSLSRFVCTRAHGILLFLHFFYGVLFVVVYVVSNGVHRREAEAIGADDHGRGSSEGRMAVSEGGRAAVSREGGFAG